MRISNSSVIAITHLFSSALYIGNHVCLMINVITYNYVLTQSLVKFMYQFIFMSVSLIKYNNTVSLQ